MGHESAVLRNHLLRLGLGLCPSRLAGYVVMSHWTGPLDTDLEADGHTLKAPVPPERWPFCHPFDHDDCCNLRSGGLFCDCAASAADE